MTSTIPLAKPYTPNKLVFPVTISRKVDGVPVKFTITLSGECPLVVSESRQGKRVPSVDKLLSDFAHTYIAEDLPLPATFVGEVYQRGNMDADFKDTSGIVRRQYDQSDQLAIALFETDTGLYGHDGQGLVYHTSGASSWKERLEFLMYLRQIKLHKWVTPLDQYTVHDQETLDAHYNTHMVAYPKSEGMVARSYTDMYTPGKRSWGYQKIVKDPMIDLRIVQFEEGLGKNANAVGRIWADYKGTTIGIGPGKLSYDERRELWAKHKDRFLGGPIAQIKYKRDDSYDALRQPTFQCWRPDKDEPDA